MNAHEAASDWLQRLDSAELSEDELQSWLEWFGGSDENRRAFEELQALRRGFRVLPAQQRATVRDRLGLASDKDRRPLGWALAAGLGAIALATAVWWAAQRLPSEHMYAAPSDKHRTVELTDGSSLVLAADAVVAVRYTSEQRALNVERGAAYFEVKHHPTRPFVVEAAGVRVTAIGTAFNVQRDSSHVSVTVTEGVVEVASSGGLQRLSVGRRAVLPLEPGPSRSQPGEAGARHRWEAGRADFVDTPLEEVLAFVNPHIDVKLMIDDPRVGDLTYSGTILRAHLDEWVASLPRVYPVRTVPLQDGTITLVSRRE